MKEIRFKDKLAVITGAASGMGLSCSKEFVREGKNSNLKPKAHYF